MNRGTFARRDVLKLMGITGAMGLPAAPAFRPRAAHAAGATGYNPAARLDVAVSEVELRRNSAGRMLMARIYQPKGLGPFPTVLDLHGGAWNRKDRFAEEPMDRALAASGLLVVAVDMTLAPEAPYPACVQDANYAVRWLKANASTWNGDTAKIGVYASSSGGHVAELSATLVEKKLRRLRVAHVSADIANGFVDVSIGNRQVQCSVKINVQEKAPESQRIL